MDIRDKYIWITGSSGGIGLAMAQQAIQQGAAAVVLSGSNAKKLEEAVALCSQSSQEKSSRVTRVIGLCFDLSKEHEVNLAVEDYWKSFDRLDVLVHNAGISQRAPMLDTTLDVERYLMELNYWGAVRLTKLLLPQMLKNRRCSIGVTSSVTGLFGVPLRTSYCAGKHALNGYFAALQTEYFRQGLRVTIVCPGKINTKISQSALTGNGMPLGIIEKGHKRGLSAERCAKIFWHAAKRGHLFCYAARSEFLAIWLHRLSPQLGSALIRRVLPLKEVPK